MVFSFDELQLDSPFVERVWQTRSGPAQAAEATTFISRAVCQWEIVVTEQRGKTSITLRGPETRATLAPVPEEAAFLGITFKLGVFMPQLPTDRLVGQASSLPDSAGRSFWLHGSPWQIPNFANVDVFIERLVQQNLLARDPLVDAVLAGRPQEQSPRSIQRHFIQATGLTHKTIQQIERARQAAELLEGGRSILDTVYETGYFDQAHMTNALRRFTGQTPAQILQSAHPA